MRLPRLQRRPFLEYQNERIQSLILHINRQRHLPTNRRIRDLLDMPNINPSLQPQHPPRRADILARATNSAIPKRAVGRGRQQPPQTPLLLLHHTNFISCTLLPLNRSSSFQICASLCFPSSPVLSLIFPASASFPATANILEVAYFGPPP